MSRRDSKEFPCGLPSRQGAQAVMTLGDNAIRLHQSERVVRNTAELRMRVPPATPIIPKRSPYNRMPSMLPSSGSKLTKIPALDAGTDRKPQFHNVVLRVVARSPCAASANHVFGHRVSGGGPLRTQTQRVSPTAPGQEDMRGGEQG